MKRRGSSGTGSLPSGRVDLTGDEDPTDEDEYYWNSDNTGDEGKIVGGAIRVCGGIGNSLLVASYACKTFIYGSSCKGEKTSVAKRYLVKSLEESGEVFLRTRSLYQKIYWESLPEDTLGVITRRHTGSHYRKTYWESLPKDILLSLGTSLAPLDQPWDAIVGLCLSLKEGDKEGLGDECWKLEELECKVEGFWGVCVFG
ncbi:hypothetical protein Tco_1181511 [Tanacetum coccineum]